MYISDLIDRTIRTCRDFNVRQLVMKVVRQNGLLGLYNGLSASWLRMGTYCTARWFIYNKLKACSVVHGKECKIFLQIPISHFTFLQILTIHDNFFNFWQFLTFSC